MTEPLFSDYWYRIAELSPRLQRHAEVHRHHYRGELCYVLELPASQRSYRLTPCAYAFVSLLDGARTVETAWEEAGALLGEDAPSQDQVLQLLSDLYRAGALRLDSVPDFERALPTVSARRSTFRQILVSPLIWRLPLCDPQRFLSRCYPYVRPFLGRAFVLVWAAVVLVGSFLVCVHMDELSAGFSERVLSPVNLLILWLLFPVLKTLHELGHAFAVQRHGGEVHEMGILFLVFMPLPYVDASAASAFSKKRERLIVGAGGILVETLIGFLAFFAWLAVEPGFTSVLCFNVFLIGVLSSVLSNANPLLRFDGYYLLADAIELPNLRSRSRRYVGYLIERYLFGNPDHEVPATSRRERAWFVSYLCASLLYQFVVVTAILLFVASKFFFVGVVLATWCLVTWVALPLVKGVHHLLRSPQLERVRVRAVSCSLALVALFALALFLPVPLRTQVEGVLIVPEESIVRAGADGFVDGLLAEPGSEVKAGDPLIRCRDPQLASRVRVLEAEVAELEAHRDAVWIADRVEADVLNDEIEQRRKTLARERNEFDELTIRSPVRGRFVLSRPDDLAGRFVRKGAPVAHVLDAQRAGRARVVVSQEHVDLVRQQTRRVELRKTERVHDSVPVRVVREVPAASQTLPSSALGTRGGGVVALDPADPEGKTSFERLFHFELEAVEDDPSPLVGGRVFVRFDHGWEPFADRCYRAVRRLFLRSFNV